MWVLNVAFIFKKLMPEKLLKYAHYVSMRQVRKRSSERVHKCDNCGYQTDRDVAAA
ncbi:MAG: hypothetical protein WBF90_23640 [Rivularia sp. (in: cyanobacteria)]